MVLVALLLDNRLAVHAAGLDVASGDGLNVEALGACPDAATVHRIVTSVVSADEARGATVSIQDRGPHYRIAVRGEATTLNDPARDCAARARQAAVVVAGTMRSHPLVRCGLNVELGVAPPPWMPATPTPPMRPAEQAKSGSRFKMSSFATESRSCFP